MVRHLSSRGCIDLYHARYGQHLVQARRNRSPSDAELGILTIFRMARMLEENEMEGPFKKAPEGLSALASMAARYGKRRIP